MKGVGARNEKAWMDAHDEKMWVHAARRHGCMRQEGADARDEKAGMYVTKRRGCT